MPRQTPLHQIHQRLGATLTEFAGWLMPLRYGSETAEHRAVRQAAGLFDLSHMGEITVTGPQAGQALDYALVGELSTLSEEHARYTMLCADDGGVLDDLVVYRVAAQQYLVVANAANATPVYEALQERAASYDARVENRTSEYVLLAIQGPRAAEIVAQVSDAPLAEVRYYTSVPATVAGFPVLLARTGYTGEDGFEIFCSPEAAVPIWEELDTVGRPHGAVPAGLAARDTLRLEAGMPLYGNELSPQVTPYEAGLGRVVRLDKPGPFVGREALERRAKTGPTRRLVGLVGRGRRVARHGHAVYCGARRCGEVTSGAPSPTLGRPIAMAYVDVLDGLDDTATVDIRGRREVYDVVELPFYRRPR